MYVSPIFKQQFHILDDNKMVSCDMYVLLEGQSVDNESLL